MPMLTPTTRFEHRVKWIVRNFHMCPPWENVDVISPSFQIRLLDVVCLRFFLRVLGPGKGMFFALAPEEIVGPFKYQRPSFKLAVAVTNIKRDHMFGLSEQSNTTENIDPSSYTTWAFLPFDPPKDLETLVLLVTVTTTVDQDKYWSQMLDPHLVYLTNNLVAMATNPTHNDFLMVSGGTDSVGVETHSCILRARMPCLFRGCGSGAGSSGQGMDEIGLVETGAPPDVLRTALYYLYGRLFLMVPYHQKKELLKFAEKYELEHLENMLTSYPTEFSIITSLLVEEISFSIKVADIKWDNPTPTTKFYSFEGISTGVLLVDWAITSDQSIAFTCKFPDISPRTPLHARCQLQLKNEFGRVVKEFVSWHTFTDDNPWSSPALLNRKEIDQHSIRSISWSLQVTEGDLKIENEIVEDSGYCDSEEGAPLMIFNNLLDFRDQLKELYVNQVGCDFELDMGAWKFRVHKAIVMARSPTIRGKVESKEDFPGDAKVVSISLKQYWEEHYHVMLIYMYSGIIDFYEEDFMDRLVTVADYLGINYVTDHCSFAHYEK